MVLILVIISACSLETRPTLSTTSEMLCKVILESGDIDELNPVNTPETLGSLVVPFE